MRARGGGGGSKIRRRRRQPVVVGGKCTRAHHPAAALRPRRVCYGSYIDARCRRASAVTPRPRPPRRRARRKAPRKFAERTRSAVCAGPHPPAECLQRRGERGPRVHPCAQELAGKPPPAHCRSRRRSRAAGPASPEGGGGGDCWGGLVAPPLEQLARVHAVYGSRLIRTEMQLLPSHPHGVSSLRKRTTGGDIPVTNARLPSNMIMSTFVPFINGFIPRFSSITDQKYRYFLESL